MSVPLDPPTEGSIQPAIDAVRSIAVPGVLISLISDDERHRLTSVATELATLSCRAESASAEVLAIEGRMKCLVDELTSVAGVTLVDATDPAP